MSACSTDPCIFAGGFCTLKSITVIIVTVVGVALLYRYRRRLKGKSPYAFYGLIGIVLLVGVTVTVLVSTTPTTECGDSGRTGVSFNQYADRLDITVVHVGNIDSILLVGPDALTESNGTRSTVMDRPSAGDRFTLRSNEQVINFLNNPENNITVPTISGTKTVENVGELPFEYRKAPAGFVNPDANISSYDNASVATVACLYTNAEDFELGGRHVPAGSSIPCSTPFLAQKIDSEEVLGTHVKPGSGPNKGKVLTSPVTLKKGEYQLIGQIDGRETVIQSFEVTDELAGGER